MMTTLKIKLINYFNYLHYYVQTYQDKNYVTTMWVLC